MATSSWIEAPLPVNPTQSWVEKYRAALIETNPKRQLERIAEAYEAIQGCMQAVLADNFEKQAIDDARLILSLLREESLGRAASAPWL
ncbi:MAG: hypothetical protein DMG71_17545 [Acidobacteria bacterium]|nr:MAG: hypothetical protein DMG71_17545 [Acidobacteriota bacterium]